MKYKSGANSVYSDSPTNEERTYFGDISIFLLYRSGNKEKNLLDKLINQDTKSQNEKLLIFQNI